MYSIITVIYYISVTSANIQFVQISLHRIAIFHEIIVD